MVSVIEIENPFIRKEKGYKVCSKCHKELPKENFGKARVNKDGLNGRCKDCVRLWNNQYREENRTKVREANTNWVRKNPELRRKRLTRTYINFLEKQGYTITKPKNDDYNNHRRITEDFT
jgi:hypothetical protein